MDIIAIIISIYLFIRLSTLQDRVSNLEKKQEVFEKNVSSEAVDVNLPPVPSPHLYNNLDFIKHTDASQAKDSSVSVGGTEVEAGFGFINWIKEDFMMKLGGFLLLIALGWFVSYAFANNWIGPAGRITLGIFFGLSLMIVGIWRIREFRHQGGVFTVIGSTTILLTVFAAREIYGFFTPVSALFVMFMAITLVAFVSVRYSSEKLAISGLLLAGLAPLLTSASLWDPIVVFSYLLMVTAGTLWVVWFTGWTKLTFISLVITYLYSLSFIYDYNQDVVLTYSFLFVLAFFVANVVSLVRRREDDTHLGVHALTALGTAVFLFTWIEHAALDEWKSLLYTAWALVFAFGTYVAFKFTANYKAFYLYGATAIALIGMATASELDGPILVVAYIVEITMLIIATTKITYQAKLPAYQSLLFIIPGVLSLENISRWSYRQDGLLHADFVVVTLMMIVLGVVAMIISVRQSEKDSGVIKFISGLLYFGFGFYAVTWVWLTTHSLFSEGGAALLSLVIYTLVGIKSFIYGRSQDLDVFKVVGALLIGISLIVLFTVVMGLSTTFKIIIFFIIGILLISTAFMSKKKEENNNQ